MTTVEVPSIASRLHVEHFPWCDVETCYVDDDPLDGITSHYGKARALPMDAPDAWGWRTAPSGPEIEVGIVHLDGHPGIEVAHVGDQTSGSVGCSWLTLTEAKELISLLQAAIAAVAADD